MNAINPMKVRYNHFIHTTGKTETLHTTGKTETSIGQKPMEVGSKPTEINFFYWLWTNFRWSLADKSFVMKVTPTKVS
jgi:hypothetical protein